MARDSFGGQVSTSATANVSRRHRAAGRRWITLTLILATAAPNAAVVHGQQPQTHGQAKIRIVPPVARALAVDDHSGAGTIQQTSGGMLGNLFGSSGSSSKPKDDGRRAYALPAPDPASVNWNGVPYHAPAAGQAGNSTDAQPIPLRDVAAGTARSGNSFAGNAKSTEASQPFRTSSATRSASGSITDTGVKAPAARANGLPQPMTDAPAVQDVAPRVAVAPTLTAPSQSPANSDSLSTSTSSRRSDRRQVTPLSLDAAELSQQADSDFDVVDVAPSVDRRSLADTSTPPSLELMAPVSRTAPGQPAADSKSYPEESLAGQLSPLRPSESVSAIGSGVADLASPSLSAPLQTEAASAPQALVAAAPAVPVQTTPAPAASKPPAATKAATPLSSLVTAASESTGIRVVTEGPAEIQIGELTQYEIRVENRGSLTSSGVTVQTALPAWAEVVGHNASVGEIVPPSENAAGELQWQIEQLPAGSVERLFVRVKPTQAGTFGLNTQWSAAPQSHTAQVTVRQAQLTVEIEGPDQITYGESQKYRVRVLNPGDGVASNIVFTLAPDAEDAVQQPIGDIPAGKEASFEVELTARDFGELRIVGAAAGDRQLVAEAEKIVSVVAANLQATLTGPPLRYLDSDAAYQLQVVNRGNTATTSLQAEIEIPAGVQYVGGIEGAKQQGNRLVWQVASLAAGETLNYDFACKMTQTGDHQLRFSARGTAAAQTSVELATVVEAIADLKLAVFDPQAPAPVGVEVTYEVHVNNRGSKAAEDVRVVAQFGHGIEPIRVQGHDGEVVTGQVLFAPIARLEAGSQLVLKVVAKADKSGDHRFRAEVRSGETVLVAEEATVFVGQSNERISRSSTDSMDR